VKHEPIAVEPAPDLPPIWKESLWPVDWLALRLSPVYYGLGVPRGDGSPVVVVPGFMCTDAYLYELYLWLGRIGYRPYASGIGVNAQCPGRLSSRLLATVERAHHETGRPVRIVGHSLGGILGRRASLLRPDLVSQLIYLGSPLQAVHAHPAVVAAAVALHAALTMIGRDSEDCLTERCRCGFAGDAARSLPGSVRHSAIYTRGDGVVDWHDSQEDDPRLNHEVGGTHLGLVFNSRAYRVLAHLLAEPDSLQGARGESGAKNQAPVRRPGA
jgi:pimeloyl-ACP methyl ester carboxylesterase